MGVYVPTDWNDGGAPAITAAQLDRMEAGIAAAHTELNAGGSGSANANMFFRRDGTLTVLEGNRFRVRKAFTLQEMAVDLDIAGTGATTLQVRVYKGGANTTGVISVAASATQPAALTGLSVAFAAGDYISVGVSQQDTNKTAVGLSVTLGIQYS